MLTLSSAAQGSIVWASVDQNTNKGKMRKADHLKREFNLDIDEYSRDFHSTLTNVLSVASNGYNKVAMFLASSSRVLQVVCLRRQSMLSNMQGEKQKDALGDTFVYHRQPMNRFRDRI